MTEDGLPAHSGGHRDVVGSGVEALFSEDGDGALDDPVVGHRTSQGAQRKPAVDVGHVKSSRGHLLNTLTP
jgi:hypothetical protein